MPLASFVLAAALFAAPCPVTPTPAPQFVPPALYAPQLETGSYWFGTPELWTQLPATGARARRDKSFWWSAGYDGFLERYPNLTVAIKPFYSGVKSFVDARATNAFFGGAWSMLTMLEFPEPDCREMTGSYRGRTLTFVTAAQ